MRVTLPPAPASIARAAADLEAGVALLRDHARDAPAAGLGVGHREDGVDVRRAAVRRPLLVALEEDRVVLDGGAGRQPARVRPRLPLGEPEGDELPACRDLRQVLALLGLRPREDDGKRPQRVDGVHDAHAAAGPRELLDDEAEVEDARARAAVLL